MNPYLQFGALGLLAIVLTWIGAIIKKFAEAMITRIETGDAELVKALNDIRSLVSSLREENRFLRESFSELTRHMSEMMQRWRVADAIHEFHNQEQSEVHSMTMDLHRQVYEGATGVHRRKDIEKRAQERKETLAGLDRESDPPVLPKR